MSRLPIDVAYEVAHLLTIAEIEKPDPLLIDCAWLTVHKRLLKDTILWYRYMMGLEI